MNASGAAAAGFNEAGVALGATGVVLASVVVVMTLVGAGVAVGLAAAGVAAALAVVGVA
jgi:hypothetical protein